MAKTATAREYIAISINRKKGIAIVASFSFSYYKHRNSSCYVFIAFLGGLQNTPAPALSSAPALVADGRGVTLVWLSKGADYGGTIEAGAAASFGERSQTMCQYICYVSIYITVIIY